MRSRRFGSILCMLAGMVVVMGMTAPVHAAQTVTTTAITAPPDAATDRFGFASDVNEDSGTVALVGAPSSNPPVQGDFGHAFVFTRGDGTWPEQAELIPSLRSPQDFFGGSVALNGDGSVALVGSPGSLFAFQNVETSGSPFPGKAYIFTEHNGVWTQQTVLSGSDDPRDMFGFTVALSRDGHEAIVGAPGANDDNGAAYLFEEQGGTWALDSILTDPDSIPGDNFGFSVSMNPEGHEVLVGATQGGHAGDPPTGAGYADVYVQNDDGTWPAAPTAKLVQDDPTLGDGFGDSVALNGPGHVALIGAEGKDGFNGAAYTFAYTDETGWTQRQEILDPNPGFFDVFGYAVAIDGNADVGVIGAPFKDGFTGKAFRFTGKVGSWTDAEQTGATADYGTSVALDHEGDVELVGADGEDGDGGNGVVYVYEF